ncbi:hypothetical protein ABW365_23300 [Enterococcus avium]
MTGDLETTGEETLIRNYPQLKTDFLKVGHHGSNTSTGKELLEKSGRNTRSFLLVKRTVTVIRLKRP